MVAPVLPNTATLGVPLIEIAKLPPGEPMLASLVPFVMAENVPPTPTLAPKSSTQ